MYRGFTINDIPFDVEPYYEAGKARFDLQKTTIGQDLKAFMFGENALDASEMQANWFPQVKAHVFLSHSHRDARKAVGFAGWLYHYFRIEAFIDSLLWGYCDDLLKLIDDQYSKTAAGRYNYKKRNISTSHIHMMLSTALAMMMDKTECLLFMDTPNSVMPVEDMQKTLSPWIYFEIATSQMIEKKPPQRTSLLEGLEEGLVMAYDLDLNHLDQLSGADLHQWVTAKRYRTPEKALDELYMIKPAPLT